MKRSWTFALAVAFFLAGSTSALARPPSGKSRDAATEPGDGDAPRTSSRHRATARRGTPAAPARGRVEPRPEKPGSVGYPNEGRLEGGVRLDLSKPYLRVVPTYERGDVRWGLPAMVGMLERAARAVARRHKGAVLSVGDLSRRGGGEVMRHHSHESGRDADLGFYLVDAAGKPVHARGFVPIDSSLASTAIPGARFDLARNWLLVQHMVTDPVAKVSHIFVSEPIRQRLLAYARSIGVSQGVRDRAAIAMMQPTSALPHDDHFHVRISCPRAMRETCVELAKEEPRRARRHARIRTPERAAPRGPSSLDRSAPRGAASPARSPTSAAAGRQRMPAPVAPVAPKRGRPAWWPSAQGLGALSRTTPIIDRDEADADAAEVKDAIDDSGTLKITD